MALLAISVLQLLCCADFASKTEIEHVIMEMQWDGNPNIELDVKTKVVGLPIQHIHGLEKALASPIYAEELVVLQDQFNAIDEDKSGSVRSVC